MFNSEFGRKLATVACTLVFSAVCVAGAVGPATASGSTTVTVARLMA